MELLAGILGAIVGGTIAMGFLAMIVRWIVKKILDPQKDPLPFS